MTAAIITIGDELLIGQVINTNQVFIAERLQSVGITIQRMLTVGDNEQEILDSFEDGFSAPDVIVVRGGLGPTHDDITRAVVCRFFNTDLVVNEQALQRITELFRRRGIPLIKLNEDQALVPRDCTVIQNSQGTAPGYLFERKGKYCIVMPGVPFEMKAMMEEFVIPFFAQRGTGGVIRHRTLKTTGIGESILANQIGDVAPLLAPYPGVTLAFLPSPTGVRLRITAQGSNPGDVAQMIRQVEDVLRAKAEKFIYGVDDEELEEVVGKLLLEHGLTIAIAESCTGGLIADRFTNVPGSSGYFERGVIAYSNVSKVAMLRVPSSLLDVHGAVSKEVAEAMAGGIRTVSKTSIGLSTTGIAGPTGGTGEKPVGLVWIGYSDAQGTLAMKFHFGEDRRRVKERAAQAALELVRRKLLKIDHR